MFFTTHNGQNWVCSASTVNSNGKDAVITAGHCVYGSLGGEVGGEGWHTNWIFVPDCSNGYAPYGCGPPGSDRVGARRRQGTVTTGPWAWLSTACLTAPGPGSRPSGRCRPRTTRSARADRPTRARPGCPWTKS